MVKGIVMPLGILFLAGMITPLNPNQPNSVINPSIGGLNSNATLTCSFAGCTSFPSITPQQLCNGNNGLGNSAIVKDIQNTPGLNTIFNFFAGLGEQFIGFITGTNTTKQAQACFQASTTLVTIRYNTKTPDSITYAFIGVLMVVLGIVILTGITIAGSGLNTGAVFIIFIGTILLVFWIILSGNAVATFRQIPSPYGAYLYLALTLIYALNVVGEIGTLKSD